MSEDGYLDWQLLTPRADELAHVTSLQIFLPREEWEHLNQAGSIIDRTPALRSLDLELERCGIFDRHNCCDSAFAIVKIMLRSRGENKRPLMLKTLRITSMCLRLSGHLLLESLRELENLQLIRCRDIDSFLRELSTLRLSLSSVCIDKPSVALDHSGSAVGDFLLSLTSAKRIILRLPSDAFPGRSVWQALQQHASSIECLSIEEISPDGIPRCICRLFDLTSHTEMLMQAPRLEQLAFSGFDFEAGWWQRSGKSRTAPGRNYALLVSIHVRLDCNVIITTDRVAEHTRTSGSTASLETHDGIVGSEHNRHPNPNVVYASCVADCERSCREDIWMESSEPDCGGLCGLRTAGPPPDPQSICVLAFKAIG